MLWKDYSDWYWVWNAQYMFVIVVQSICHIIIDWHYGRLYLTTYCDNLVANHHWSLLLEQGQTQKIWTGGVAKVILGASVGAPPNHRGHGPSGPPPSAAAPVESSHYSRINKLDTPLPDIVLKFEGSDCVKIVETATCQLALQLATILDSVLWRKRHKYCNA